MSQAVRRGLWSVILGFPLALSCGAEESSRLPFVAHRNLDYVETKEYADQKDRLDVFAPPEASQDFMRKD